MRVLLKRAVQAIAIVLMLPSALLCGFGRVRVLYTIFAHAAALWPGQPGNLLRAAFYRMCLADCSIDISVAFGSFFVHPEAGVGELVSIGSYCVIGKARIGARTQMASQVQITSGRHQHERDAEGNLTETQRTLVEIGADCWIGAGAIVMADVGAGSTVGAGAIVTKPIPAGATAVGNPARVIKMAAESEIRAI